MGYGAGSHGPPGGWARGWGWGCRGIGCEWAGFALHLDDEFQMAIRQTVDEVTRTNVQWLDFPPPFSAT